MRGPEKQGSKLSWHCLSGNLRLPVLGTDLLCLKAIFNCQCLATFKFFLRVAEFYPQNGGIYFFTGGKVFSGTWQQCHLANLMTTSREHQEEEEERTTVNIQNTMRTTSLLLFIIIASVLQAKSSADRHAVGTEIQELELQLETMYNNNNNRELIRDSEERLSRLYNLSENHADEDDDEERQKKQPKIKPLLVQTGQALQKAWGSSPTQPALQALKSQLTKTIAAIMQRLTSLGRKGTKKSGKKSKMTKGRR